MVKQQEQGCKGCVVEPTGNVLEANVGMWNEDDSRTVSKIKRWLSTGGIWQKEIRVTSCGFAAQLSSRKGGDQLDPEHIHE